jgi:hypothetical protein
MQIDSVRVHEALNHLAIEAHKFNICSAVEAIKAVRRALNDIESITASKNWACNHSGALEK